MSDEDDFLDEMCDILEAVNRPDASREELLAAVRNALASMVEEEEEDEEEDADEDEEEDDVQVEEEEV